MNNLHSSLMVGAVLAALVSLSACVGQSVDEVGIPDEAAAVQNPVEATDDSLAAGRQLYDLNCAVCHGQGGKGDGPGGVGLNPPPSDLTAAQTQDRTDGALFYIISEGIRGTAMPPWQAQFSEEDRWHVVNYLRSLA